MPSIIIQRNTIPPKIFNSEENLKNNMELKIIIFPSKSARLLQRVFHFISKKIAAIDKKYNISPQLPKFAKSILPRKSATKCILQKAAERIWKSVDNRSIDY
jgi:hypothetical protein